MRLFFDATLLRLQLCDLALQALFFAPAMLSLIFVQAWIRQLFFEFGIKALTVFDAVFERMQVARRQSFHVPYFRFKNRARKPV